MNNDGTAVLFSTYLGGGLVDQAQAIAVDQAGRILIAGVVDSDDFPLQNPIQSEPGGDEDAFVAAFDLSPSALAFSTYLGGEKVEWPAALDVDLLGNVYLLGSTRSPDFPTTAGAFQSGFAGGLLTCGNPPFDPRRNCEDIFVTRLDAGDFALGYSTYLGGGREDWGQDIVVDQYGRAHVAGYTTSSDFPGGAGATANHILISLLSVDGRSLERTVTLASQSYNTPHGLFVDAAGDFYLTGAINAPADSYIVKFDDEDVVATADLGLTLAANPSPVMVGDLLTYTADVHNYGPLTTTLTTMDLALPVAHVAFVSASASQGSCSLFGATVTCDLGALHAEDSATVVTLVEVIAAGAFQATAVTGSDVLDPDPANNSAAVTVMATTGDRLIYLPIVRRQ